jgi:hypothetical protein
VGPGRARREDLIASDERGGQVIADVTAALAQGRNCLVLTNWTEQYLGW